MLYTMRQFGSWLRRFVGLEPETPVSVTEPAVDDVPTAESASGPDQDDLLLSVFRLGHETGWRARGEDDDRRRETRVAHETEQLLEVLHAFSRRPAGRPLV